jgi:hypothetical protein
MSIKIAKRHMLKDISHFKSRKEMTRNEIRNSQREQGSNKRTKLPTLFMMAHKVQKGKVYLPTISNTNLNKHKSVL